MVQLLRSTMRHRPADHLIVLPELPERVFLFSSNHCHLSYRIDQDRSLAAKPVHIELGHRSREQHRDTGVDGVPSGQQDPEAGLRGERIAGRDGPAPPPDHGIESLPLLESHGRLQRRCTRGSRRGGRRNGRPCDREQQRCGESRTRRRRRLGTGGLPLALAPANDKRIQVQTAHFTLYSNASERRTLDLGRRLERFRAVLAGFYKKFRADPPVTTSAYVFRNDESFTPYKSRFHGRPADIAGLFLGAADGNYIEGSSTPSPGPSCTISCGTSRIGARSSAASSIACRTERIPAGRSPGVSRRPTGRWRTNPIGEPAQFRPTCW